MSKAAARAAKKERARQGREQREERVDLVQAQDYMLGVRNRILQRLHDYLTAEELVLLRRTHPEAPHDL